MFESQNPAPSTEQAKSDSSWTSSRWFAGAVAAVIVAAFVGVLIMLGGHRHGSAESSTVAPAPPDPYAASLVISGVKMSEAVNFAGSKVTYLEGELTNKGGKTVIGATVEVVFRNALGEAAQRETLPVMLIRTREPYVDTEPVDAAPIKPGAVADFRLVFDHVAEDWNAQYPEVRVTAVRAK